MSRPYAEVIGDPIAHSKSPLIHNFWLDKLGIDAEYRACHVRPEELADYLARRRGDADWRGCNVTMPHKQAVLPLVDEIDTGVERIGAANTVVREANSTLAGHNTDAAGFYEPLRQYVGNQGYLFAHLIGSGGAARAIADALYSAKFTIFSYSRNPAKAKSDIGRYLGDDDFLIPIEALARAGKTVSVDPERLDLLINTTSLGMVGNPPLRVEFSGFPEDLIVYDIVTAPVDTELLKSARSCGLRTIDGLAMLIGQAAVAFQKFFGQPAPREHDTELRALLTA